MTDSPSRYIWDSDKGGQDNVNALSGFMLGEEINERLKSLQELKEQQEEQEPTPLSDILDILNMSHEEQLISYVLRDIFK